MKQQSPKQIVRVAILVLAFSLVLPSMVKFAHAFAHHKHEVCLGESHSHFHNVDLDCDFYKFKLNHNFYVPLVNYELQEDFKAVALKLEYYTFLKSHQQTTSYLRGPPRVVLFS